MFVYIVGLFVTLGTLAGCGQKEIADQDIQEERDVFLVVNGQEQRSETISLLAPDDGIILLASDVEYSDGYSDFFIQPTQPGAYPGIILVHNHVGLTEDMKDLAKVLSVYGYSVLAVDLFDGKTTMMSGVNNLVQSTDKQSILDHLLAAEDYLRSQRAAPRVGVIGWGFGGDQALQLAISSQSLDGAVFYYAKPRTDDISMKNISAQLLGIYGEDDDSVSIESVELFSEQLSGYNVDHAIFIYPNVGHDFANLYSENYASEETQQAWKRVLLFFQEILY